MPTRIYNILNGSIEGVSSTTFQIIIVTYYPVITRTHLMFDFDFVFLRWVDQITIFYSGDIVVRSNQFRLLIADAISS